ncbi:tRNA ligase [Niveomyces insectorum RCEF 264]|uniref:tRNA ligase n=1 Tax=Niveomyces insectorum RCEF 264 TaxID=1081102 RepID=A0A162J914_9HYPO|nr:tRNA ligase [Niveomyces insectorum RCEF 264]
MSSEQVGDASLGAPVLPKTPYESQDVHEVAELIRSLEDATKSKKKSDVNAKKTRFSVQNSANGLFVDSWKFRDWDYKRRDLPTYARGLFTTRDKHGLPEIAVRGYDKFFNVNEVHETQWENIEARTVGPYEITLKENGCIIFISALSDHTLLVCSKHSTGDRGDVELSHSSAGERRLEEQLARIGKTKEDLARELRARNATAVAELCDDTFEEHILAYGPDKAGLYLHGINLNLPNFRTYPSALVQAFAGQWGFRQVDLKIMNDIAEVQRFLESVAETGAHDGRDVEGFVIRCQMSPNPDTLPYQDWFFKYKFEEPYLMYRQWRECTKALISGRSPIYKKHKAITEQYLMYARKRIAADPKLGRLYQKNHGIIQLRDDFLAYKNLNGSDAANFDVVHDGDSKTEVTGDVILVPVATIGCGKTTIGIALSHLLGFGIVQNDNITGSRRPPRFTRMVLEELQTHPAVFADRNNAQRHERKQILEDVKIQHASARLVALNFVHTDIDAVRAVTHERVFARGDNHQTIHAATDQAKVVNVMEGFIHRFERLDPTRLPDSGFDAIIDLDPTDSSRENVEKVVRDLYRLYPNLVTEVPAAEAMDAAVNAAIADYNPSLRHKIRDHGMYKPPGSVETKHEQQQQHKQVPKKKPLEYFAVHVAANDVKERLEKTFQDLSPAESRFFKQLQQTRRVQSAFHVTLMHRASAKERPELWEQYVRKHAEAEAAEATKTAATATANSNAVNLTPDLGQVDVQLERVVFDDRLMAIVVRLVDKSLPGDAEKGAAASGGDAHGWVCVNRVSHITVGTRDDGVKPKESNDLLSRWLDEGSTAENGIVDIVVEGQPLLPGVVRGVLSR